MTRIVGGVAGGRRISVPTGAVTRPTSDRAREALFSALESIRGPFAGARVLDLYAGSGALGLEALSRGAAVATFVEADPRVVAVLRGNVDGLGLPGAEIRHDRVERAIATPPDAAYDVALLDPPYRQPGDDVRAVLTALGAGWLDTGAAVVVERSSRDPLVGWPEGYDVVRERAYGEVWLGVSLWYGHRS